MKTGLYVLAALFLTGVAACSKQEPAAVNDSSDEVAGTTASVRGTISYRERIALSPGAVVEVILQDVSLADAKSKVISKQKLTGPGQVPIRFELEYSPQDIDERMSYAIQARISEHGRLMFINDTHTPVLTRGAGNEVEMVLVRVQDSTPPSDHGIELEGMFRYMADAALFRDCRTNKSFPVAMEGAYMELERAYSNSGIGPGEEIMVSLRGRYLERPAMEGDSNEINLIVDIFKEILPDKTCAPVTHAELENTYWKLVEIGGEPVTTPEGMKDAHVILASDDGQFELKDDSLTFSAMGSTMMACPEGMDTEQAFLQALGSANRYRISGLFLELFDGDTLLARLEAIYL
jgi:uncharacterized lipoprotein YbaY